jgi:hypothetical protein
MRAAFGVGRSLLKFQTYDIQRVIEMSNDVTLRAGLHYDRERLHIH